MKKVFLILLAMMLAVSMVAVGCPGPDDDDDEITPAEFYEGKTITIYAGPAGSGVDVGARLIAKYLEDEIGATIVVENYSEIGGLKSYNLLYDATPDGLTMGCHTLSTVWQNGLLEDPTALYKTDEFVYLGSSLMAPMALWTLEENYDSVEALQAGEGLLQAAGSPLGYMAFWGTLAGIWLDLDFQTIPGLGGPPAVKHQVEIGEHDFTNIAIHTGGIYPDLIPVVLIDDQRHDIYPDCRAITEIVDLTPQQETWLAMGKYGGLYAGAGFAFPPGVDQDKADYIAGAMAKVAADPALIAEAKAAFGGVWGWHNAAQVQANLALYLANLDDFKEIESLVRAYYIT